MNGLKLIFEIEIIKEGRYWLFYSVIIKYRYIYTASFNCEIKNF